MSTQRKVICLLSAAIVMGVMWNWYKSTNKKKKERKKQNPNRFTHFLSIRITNPLLIDLGKELQNEISEEYNKKGVKINTSLINPSKFHISFNILSLTTEEKLKRFCHGLKLFETWLNCFVFNQKSEMLYNETFMEVVARNDYLTKFKNIYNKILSSKQITYQKGLPLYCEGVNHFSQSVIFLDFKNKFNNISESQNMQNIETETQRNVLILQLLAMIHQFIRKLCIKYKIKCDKKQFIAHCTLLKLSKMKKREMKPLLKYNQTNDIYKIKLNDKNKNVKTKRGRNTYRVYDMNILSQKLSAENLEKKLHLLQKKTYQMISQIDLCAMQGISDDGYYKTIDSFSIISS